jgi:hypothetical protein
MAAAVGLVLMAFLFLSALREAADRHDSREGERLLNALGMGFVTILFAPVVIYVLNNGAIYAAAGFKGSVVNPSLSGAVSRLGSIGEVSSAIPGGSSVGLIIFVLMLLGAVGMFIGNVVNQFGLEMAATAIAILAATRVHPRWEDRGKKAALTVLGLLAARPLLMLVLGWAAGIINDSLDPATLQAGGMKALTGLAVAAVAVLSIGMAPFALLKWLPVSPTRPESHDTSGGGMGLAGPALGATGSMLAMGGSRARDGVPGTTTSNGERGPTGRTLHGQEGQPGGPDQSGGVPTPGRRRQPDSPAQAGTAPATNAAKKTAAASGSKTAAPVGAKAAAGGTTAGAAFAADALRQIGQSGVAKARHLSQNQGVEVEHNLGGERL